MSRVSQWHTPMYDHAGNQLRADIVRVCQDYNRHSQGLRVSLFGHDNRGKNNWAELLRESAHRDSTEQLKANICNAIDWLDRRNHNSTRLRRPLEDFEARCAGLGYMPSNAGPFFQYS